MSEHALEGKQVQGASTLAEGGQQMEMQRPGLVMCVCTGKCPGFEQLDIWDFINQVRVELPVEFGMIHPQLCEEDGDRFLADLLLAERPLIIAGCAPNMQFKLFRDAFAARGMDVKKDMVPLDIRDMPTDQAVKKVADALHSMGVEDDV
jgi:heterodisulfide reductase subunit A-like polyferredoxin